MLICAFRLRAALRQSRSRRARRVVTVAQSARGTPRRWRDLWGSSRSDIQADPHVDALLLADDGDSRSAELVGRRATAVAKWARVDLHALRPPAPQLGAPEAMPLWADAVRRQARVIARLQQPPAAWLADCFREADHVQDQPSFAGSRTISPVTTRSWATAPTACRGKGAGHGALRGRRAPSGSRPHSAHARLRASGAPAATQRADTGRTADDSGTAQSSG